MSEKTLTEKVAEYEASGETYEREFYETDGTFKGEWDFDQADYNPTEGNYSVSDYINDRQVIKAFENVTAYLADQRGLGSALLDPATIGEQTDIAEFMRDDSFRIGTKFNKASLLSNAPEAVKADYRLMQNRWELSSLTGAGETLEAVKDYGIDAIFNAETIASVSSALFSRGSSIPLDIATRIAGKKALDLAIKASRAVESKTPYAYSAAIGSLFGVAEDLAFQELELSIDQRTERDLGQTAEVAGIGALMGAGLYGATRLGAKYFSKGTDPSKELVPTPEMFDEALEGELIPESGGTIVADTWALLHRYDDPDVDDIDIDDFVKDIGGGEKTKQEIRDEIRAAISSETTAEGIQNKTKQALFKAYSKLTGNFFGKAAGVLSPYTNLSATARVLQVKLSHEFGIGTKDYPSKVVEKDLSEVQKQVTGGFSEKFRGIVEDISLHSAKGTLATDINDLLMLTLRGNKAATSKTIDGDMASAINVAAGNIKKLYREMGTSLKDIGVIDSLVDNYIPRMWDRKAIEANPKKLAKLLEKKGGFAPGTGEQTVRDMLDIKDQIDSGGSGGHFFSAKRKLNEIENDADFQEFLNDDVLGSLNMYTYQAGKSIAKHRVLGVNKLAEFERLWTKRIKNELSSKGVRLSGKDIEQINLLYKTATGEGMERFDKPMQNVVDTYGFVNRIALLGFATLSSLSEIFINISKAGVIKSVKGFGEALELSQKSISGDLLNKLKTNHNLTAKEAFSEMRKFSVAMDQAMAQQGNRLAGDDLMNESLQKASNKFYKLILLDQWTRFVQTASYASGKLLINENIEALAANGGKLSTNRLKTFAGELRELDIDPDEAVAWFNKGADRKDTFYEDSFLGGAARYANSVILQPTAMSGLKPLLHSNPKRAIAFQLLGYPAAFTNTILKGAAKAIIKDPVRNVPKTLAAGVIMTGVARWTNYLRSDGESEKGRTQAEIIKDSITRFGGNGIFFDSLQRARESSMYTKNAVPYAALPFGPLGSDAIKFQAQGIIPMLGGKVPLLSGSYFGKQILGEETVSDYKATLRQLQKDIFTDTLVKKRNEPRSTLGLKKGGEVNVPNAPSEPDERIDKMTGIPYNLQAGSAFMDEEDPLKVLMNDGGKVERKKYITGAVVKGSTKLASALAERLSYKVDNYFEPEVINTAASNIEKNIKDSGIDPETPFLDAYVDALIDDTLNAKNSRSFSELKEVPEWRKLMENQDASKHGQLAEEAQKALGVTLQQRLSLETIQELRDELDPVRALESVIPNSLGNLPSEYRRIRPEGEAPRALIPQVRFLPDSVLGRLVQFLKRYIATNTDGLSEEGIERLAIENANRILRSDDPSISGLDLSKMAYMGMKDAPFEKNNMVTIKNDFRKGDVGRITGAKMSQPEGGIALYEVEVRTTGPMSDRMRLIPEDRLEHRLGSTRLVSWDTVAVSPPIDQGISGLDKLLAKDKNLQKIFKKSNLLHEAIEYSDNDSYGTLSEELQRAIKRVYFQNKVAEALTEAGYNPQRLDRWSKGEEKKGIKTALTFSEKSPIGFYSLAEKAAKELDRGQGTGNEFIKELKAAGVKEEELNWTGFIKEFEDKENVTKNDVTKFLRDNRLDVEERVDTEAWDDYTILGGATGEDPENYRAVILTLPKDKETAAGTYKSKVHFPDDHNPISHVRFSEWLMNVKAQKAEMEAAEKQRKKFLESPQHLWLLAAQRNTPFKEVTASDWDLQKVAAAKTRIIDPRFYEDHANRYLDFNDLNESLWDDFQTQVHFEIAENIKYANEITPESWKYKNSKFIQDTVDMENPKVLTVEEDQSDIHSDALRWVNDPIRFTRHRVGYTRDAPPRIAKKELTDALNANQKQTNRQYERKFVLEDELDSLSTRAELEVPDIWETENIRGLFGNRFSGDPAGTRLFRRLKRAGVSSDLLETIQANKSEINQILDKLDQLELEQERLTNLLHMRPPKPGVPDMPFKPKRGGEGYQKLNARRMLIEAAKGDYNVILLPTGREQIFRYREGYRKIENAGLTKSQLEARGEFEEIKKKDPTAMLKHYDDVLVSHFNNIGRLLVLPKKQAKKYETSKVIDIPGGSGFDHQAKSQPTPHSEEFRHQGNKMRMFVLTPEMKKDILRGLPQFYAGGLMKRRAYSEGGLYKILKGDTLSEIARDNNTSVDELAKLNKISNPSSIYEGQDLILPTTTSDLSTQTEEVLQNTAEAIGDQASETFDIVAESAGKGINALKNLLNEGIDKTKEAIDSYEAPELRQPSSTFIPAPVKLVLSSFFNKGTGTTFTEEDIGEDVTDIIDQVAKRGLAAGRKNASYEDYPDTERKLSAAALVGAAKYADGRPIPESIRAENARMRNEMYPKNLVGLARFVSDVATDPVVKAVLSVGGFSIQGEKGNYHIKEAFNFNTANVSKDDWYAWVRNKLSTSGLMPMTENEGVKVNLKIKGI